MPRKRSQSAPKLCHHKPSGRAYISLRQADGSYKPHYLGAWGSAEAKREYDRIVGLLIASPGREPVVNGVINDYTVAEVAVKYLAHSKGYNAGENGKESHTYRKIVISLRKPIELYAKSPATDFGAKSLKVVMDAWVKEGLSRKYVNEQADKVRRMFRWAVSEELVPPRVYESLKSVEGLRSGRTTAPDYAKVAPANREDVPKVLANLRGGMRAVVTVMIHSGARCGELCNMRLRDIDRTGYVWTYTPETHKGTWRGKQRTIYFGRTCQEVLAPLIDKAGSPEAFVFSPLREEEERNAERSAKRVTPKYPSHMMRNERKRKASPGRKLGEQYQTSSVRRAITRACQKAGVPIFTPHRLRHLAATIIREEFGIDAARAMLGHGMASMTEHYSHEADRKLAENVATKLG